LANAVTVDGAAHLLTAGGMHLALVLVEFNAAFLERQAAVIKNAPYAAFEVYQHVFVLYA
jgi:hypothetical protein